MNGKKAKALRKKVYGKEGSSKNPYEYNIVKGTRTCKGKRAEYQKSKKRVN